MHKGSSVGVVRASLPELYSREIKVDTRNENIYLNGIDNLYPYTIERFINNSPTASRAVALLHNFFSGKGVENDRIVNAKKGYYLSDIVDMVAGDVAPQSGSFIWVGYGVNEENELGQKTLDVLDYSNCRISLEDGHEYPGRIFEKDYSAKSNFLTRNESKETWYYPYNPNPEIVSAQMRADARSALKLDDDSDVTIEQMVRHYRGQVFYYNTTRKYKYALSRFDSVVNDADSEFRFSLYVNREFRTGFLGKLIALTQGLDDDQYEMIAEDLASLLGSENVGSMLHLNVEQTEQLDNILKVIQLKPQFDDKLFVENDKRIRRNILGAANNIPEPLIYSSEGAMFGPSGNLYKEMQLFLQDQCHRDIIGIEKALTRLGFETKIIPLIEEDNGTIIEE